MSVKSIFLSFLFASRLIGQETSPKLSLPEMPEPKLGSDSMEKPGIPKGKVTDFEFSDSKIFPGTKRQIHLYIDYNLTKNPEQRAICGTSSGGICAWRVAWERPDAFRKVASHPSAPSPISAVATPIRA